MTRGKMPRGSMCLLRSGEVGTAPPVQGSQLEKKTCTFVDRTYMCLLICASKCMCVALAKILCEYIH